MIHSIISQPNLTEASEERKMIDDGSRTTITLEGQTVTKFEKTAQFLDEEGKRALYYFY